MDMRPFSKSIPGFARFEMLHLKLMHLRNDDIGHERIPG